jgi:uncharacterized DUF497 family protein
MRYEWDPEKDALNRRKHGIGLAEGVPALNDPERVSWIDDRFDYDEERLVTVGFGRRQVLYVVCTQRGENLTRIISVRKAEGYEREKYGLG